MRERRRERDGEGGRKREEKGGKGKKKAKDEKRCIGHKKDRAGTACKFKVKDGEYCKVHQKVLNKGEIWPLECKGGDHGLSAVPRGSMVMLPGSNRPWRKYIPTEVQKYCNRCLLEEECPYCFERKHPGEPVSDGSDAESVDEYGPGYHGWDDSPSKYFGKGRHDICREYGHWDSDDEADGANRMHGYWPDEEEWEERAKRIMDRRERFFRRELRRKRRMKPVKSAMKTGKRPKKRTPPPVDEGAAVDKAPVKKDDPNQQ